MAVISKHGKLRMAERIGASAGDAAQKNANRAYKRGIQFGETKGKLRDWMYGKYRLHRNAKDMRVYRGYCYVFNRGVLITVLVLPDGIREEMEENLYPSAYERYMNDISKKENARQERNEKKYHEKKTRFDNLVMLNDVRSFAGGQYDVVFTGVNVSDGLLSICYVPNTRNIPTLQPVADHMRQCTNYRRIRLVHVKGVDGQRLYGISA